MVGVATFPAGYQAFRWSSEMGMVELGDLMGGAVFSQANGASDDGIVLVGFGTSEN